ncbi:MAG: DUF6383 domain-containing protein [Tannerellaceae bacterium]|jgi:hypothetical protein|nr:DUF6383 domain-containing protein [Tannerellaceae bacterium]
MRKKIYALIMAGCLLATSLPAQQEGLTSLRPYAGEKYVQTMSYFLKAVKGSESYYIVLDDNDRLVLRPEKKLPASFGEIKNALWRISFSQSITGEEAFTFNSLFRSTLLSLSRREATGSLQKPGVNANLPGGDIYRWLPSAGSTPSVGENFFYVFAQTGGNEVIVIGADDDLRIVPRAYANFSEAEVASDVLKITPCIADGLLPLTANDLNVRLSSSPFITGQKSGLIAREEDRFSLSTTPTFAIDYPFSSGYTFQALGVHVEEDINGFASETNSYKTDQAYADTVNHWVALYAYFQTAEGLIDQGYIGVDTSYLLINGTEPNEKAIRIASLGDIWYHKYSPEKRSRLLDSYLFKFLYDPALNRLKIISHGHITGSVEGLWNPAKEDLILSNKYALNSFLTASFVGSGRYAPTLTSNSDEEGCYIESRDDDPHYSTIIESGLYYLCVTGSHDSDRIGKYLRIGLDGNLEFVKPSDTNYRYQPSYHWAIESTLYMAKVFNREIPNAPSVDEYLGNDTRTYGVEGQRVFVMSAGERDTIAYLPVPEEFKESSSIGYYIADIKDVSYARVKFLYEAKGKKNYVSVASGNNILWVQENPDKSARFGLEEIYSETYGYEPNYELEQAGVAKLTRRYYRFTYPHDIEGTVQYLSYSDLPEAHRYFIGDDSSDSPLFLLREVNRTSFGEPAYLFCEADFSTDSLFSVVSIQSTTQSTNGALFKQKLPISADSLDKIPAFVIQSTTPYIYLGIRDNDGQLKTVQDGVQIFRTHTIDKEGLVGKPYGASPPSFNYLALQALGDDYLPESFTLRHVRGTVMPQYLVMSDYKAGTGDILFSGRSLARLDRTAENPAWIYTQLYGIPNEDISWQDNPRLGFIPISVHRDGLLYIDGINGQSIMKVSYNSPEREEEGVHNHFLFSFRLLNEEGQGFLIEGGYPNGSLAGDLNSYIRIVRGAPVSIQSTYTLASQEVESLFSWKLPDGTIQFPPPRGNTSFLPPPVMIIPSFEIVAGHVELYVAGVEGKRITLTNLLGQRLESRYATASEEHFDVPSGIIVVSVEGLGTRKVLVK